MGWSSIQKSPWKNELTTEPATEPSENYGQAIYDYYDKMSDNNENTINKFQLKQISQSFSRYDKVPKQIKQQGLLKNGGKSQLLGVPLANVLGSNQDREKILDVKLKNHIQSNKIGGSTLDQRIKNSVFQNNQSQDFQKNLLAISNLDKQSSYQDIDSQLQTTDRKIPRKNISVPRLPKQKSALDFVGNTSILPKIIKMRDKFLISGLSKTPNKYNPNTISIEIPSTQKQSLQSISKLKYSRDEDQINHPQSFISEFGKKSQDESGFLTEKYEQLVKLKYEINKIQNKEISDAKKLYDKKVRFREFQKYLSKDKRSLDINQRESTSLITQSLHNSLDKMERINSVYQKKYEFNDQYYKKKQKETFDNKYYYQKKEQLKTIDSSPDKFIEQKLFVQKQVSLQKQDEQMLINQVYQETFSPEYLEKKTRIPKEDLEVYFQKNIKNNPEAIFQSVTVKQDKLPPITQQKHQLNLNESRQSSVGLLYDNQSSDESQDKLTINQRRKITMKNIKLQIKQQSTLQRSPSKKEENSPGLVKKKTMTRSPIRRQETKNVAKEPEKPPSAPKIKSFDEILDFSKMTTAEMLALFMIKREELLRKQALKLERQRDRYFKKCNNLKDKNHIQTDSSIQRDQNLNSSIDNRFSTSDLSLNRTISSSEDNKEIEFIKIIENQDQFIKIRLNQEWDFQYDRQEALEFSHKDLPLDFLAAQLSFSNEERDYWQTYLEVNEIKEQLRRSTGFQFDKADIYNDSCGSFNEYLKSEMPQKNKETPRGLVKIVSDFQKKADFLKSIKFENKIQTRELSESKQLHLKFAEVSSKLLATPLPILLKIKNGMLCIPSSYSISQGNAQALGQSFAALDTFLSKDKKEIEMISANESGESEEEGVGAMKLYKLILDRNKMRDEDFESILFGLRHRSEFQSLTTILNTIGAKSASEIVKLIRRERVKDQDVDPTFLIPQITELRIENCMTDPKAMDSIINAISQSQINRLSFSKMKLLDIQLKGVISFVSESSNLIELDLSWNKIINKSLASLFTALSTNQTIQILNLGWVSMESSNEILDKYFPKFCEFVKSNSRLTHLDLTSINLPQKHFQMLIQDIKRSVSLHCVHFCGNRFDEKTEELLKKKLKPTCSNQMTLDEKRSVHDNFKHDLLNRIQQGVETLANREKHLRIYDSVQVKQINNEWQQVRKNYQHSTKDDPFFVPMILSKVLGHSEIRNGKHWKVTNECYMCDKWKYSFIFWDLTNQGFARQIKNPILEQQLDEMIRNSNKKFKNLQEQNLLIPAGQITPGEEGARAFIAGSFTDWQPRRMLLIDELIAYLDKKEDVLYNKDRREIYSDKIKKNWRNKLSDLSAYGTKADGGTQFINDPDLDNFNSRNPPELTFNQLFVYVDFIKPGKHSYIVSYQNLVEEPRPQIQASSPVSPNRRGTFVDYSESEDENFQKQVQQQKLDQQKLMEKAQAFIPHKAQVRLTSYHEFIGQAHLDDYNINIKSNEFDAVDRNFDRNKSVFKDWKVDNEKQVQNGLVEEIQYWAVPNIVKEESEQQEIQKILQEHAIFLKTVFIVQSSASYFPLIRYLYFGDMIRDWHIFNDKFGKLEVDNIFLRITKNMPADLVGKMPEKDMSRFQFYESLVRIAFVRYKSQGITNNTAEGLKMLIEQILLPKYQSENFNPQKYDNAIWQEWRENKLWTLEIDDLLKANLKAMKKIYEFYFIVKKTKTLFLVDAIEIFTKEIQLDLLPEQIMAAWGLSHMSVMNDIRQRERYNSVLFVEFLEFFARIAALKYKEGPYKNQSLAEKIELLMDIVFPLVSAKRKIVNIEQAYVSVSEEELDEEKYFIPKK